MMTASLYYREPLHCKVHYGKLFLQHVLARIDECDTATDVANSVNILLMKVLHFRDSLTKR